MEINGKPVVNAKQKLSITITQRDITQAKARDPGACAAARAIVREGHCKQARVHLDRTYIEHNDVWVRYRTPTSLRNEIIAIDRGGAFMPGEHELKLLSKSAQSGKRQGSTKGDNRSWNEKKKARRKIAKPNHRIEGVRPKGANI